MKKEEMPILTRANIENLLDAPYSSVLAYDYRTGALNSQTYAGRPVGGYETEISGVAKLAKHDIEASVDFGGRVLVIAAAQGIAPVSWNGMNEFVKYPLTDENSRCIAANIIAFNPMTGLYEANPKGWFGVFPPNLVEPNACHMGLQRFLMNMWARERERRKFIEPFRTK